MPGHDQNRYAQYTNNLTEAQKTEYYRIMDLYDNRFQNVAASSGVGDLDADDLTLSSYDQDIRNLFDHESYAPIIERTQRSAMIQMLVDNDVIDVGGFFRDHKQEKGEEATPIDVIRKVNFDGYADKEQMVDGDELENLRNTALARFQNSFHFPNLGKELNEIIPDYIKKDPEKLAQFEKAFQYQMGGAKIDFDESGRVGDIKSNSVIGNAVRGLGYLANDVSVAVEKGLLDTAGALYDLLGGDPAESDEEFLKAQEAGEIETAKEREERFQRGEAGLFTFKDPIYWAAFTSPEARRQYFQTRKVERAVDFQQIMDQGGLSEASAGDLWAVGIDQLVQSAPLLLDLAGGTAIAKGLLRGVTKRVAAKKVGTSFTSFIDPKTGRFISRKRGEDLLEKAAKTNNLINKGGAFIVSDALVASQIHSDNVGQEWYDNLSSGERFNYLAVQAGAEVASGMVLNNILLRGVPKSRLTHNIVNGQRNALKEYAKNVARSTFLGITEESVAEGATAGIQYVNEIRARIAGGDKTAFYDPKELNKRILEGASAGLLMGGVAGGLSGSISGAAKTALATGARNVIEAKKERQAAADALDKAVTQDAKKKAMDRLDRAVKAHSGAETVFARAYDRLAKADPEKFDEIARLQGEINVFVELSKEGLSEAEQQEVKQEIKSRIQKKQQLENDAFEGDQTFDSVVQEEAEKLQKERGDKVKEFNQSRETDPEVLTERALAGELEAQKASLEAAQAVNSAEQNADDDAQDQQGQTQEDSGMVRDESAPVEGVTGDGNTPLDPNALAGQPLAGKYRDIVGRANNLLKAFKRLGVDIVIHTTEQSYFNATGSTAYGTFRKGKTVHINLQKQGVTANTVRHEFLHAAFTTLSPEKKQEFLEQLRRIIGKRARDIEAAVERAYPNYSTEALLEEKVVNILERLLDDPAILAEQSLMLRIKNAFRKMLNLPPKEQITNSDLQGFVRQFRASERTGAEFGGQQVGQAADMDARELGMRQPSKAYPDLINKVVNYRVYYLDRLGGQQSYQTNGLRFNDYWHFRNWYLKETGNGKMADSIGQFTYTGDDGTIKKINPPKPKRDRETGEIIDMEPRLRTPQQRKMDSAAKADLRRTRLLRYADIRRNAGKALKFAVGKIEKIGRTGELTFYNEDMLLEQDSQSELPVAYSETFFTDGLNVDELDQLGKDFGDNLEFLIPTTTDAQFAFTVRNNGDGTVTIDAHSDFIPIDKRGEGDTIAQGTTNTPENLEARKLDIKGSRFLGKEANRGDMLEDTKGTKALAVGFDRTGDKSGVADLVRRGVSLISAHMDRAKAEAIEAVMVRMALEEVRVKNMKDGDIGYITMYQTLLSEESTLGNPLVFSDLLLGTYKQRNQTISRFVTRKSIEDFLNSSFVKDEAFKRKIRSMLEGGNNLEEIFDAIKFGEKVLITEEQFKEITNLLAKNSRSLSFEQRTDMSNVLLNVGRAKGVGSDFLKQRLLEKHNDPTWKEARVEKGEVVAYTVVPFRYNANGKNERAKIEGFTSRSDATVKGKPNKDNPFQGLIVPAAVVDGKIVVGAKLKDRDGNEIPLPETKIPNNAYHVREVFGGKVQKQVKDKEDKKRFVDEDVDLTGMSVEEQVKELNKRVAIGVRGISFDPDNFTAEITETKGVKEKESRPLGLNTDNESSLPFEPNRLNGFQAFMARMDQLFANKYANVFSLQRAIEKARGAVVDISQDFINAETRLYGKTANDLEKLDEKVKVISEEMKDAGLVGQDVSQFLIARHAEERNALIAERTDGETLNGSGMSNERAQEVMDGFSPEKKAALESIAKKVDAITKDTRKTMVEFGLETQETIDAFENMFKNYVPLGGLSVDEMSADTSMYPTGGAGMSIYGDTTRRAKGRASEANNVLAQVIAQNAAVHAKGRKNEALSSLYNLVKENGNTKVWRITKEVPFEAQSAVGVRIDGEQQFIVFTNPDHAKALKNMGVEKLDVFSKFMRRFSGFLRRSFTTANPEFIISNFARDIQSALFNAAAEADIPGGQIQSQFIATKIIQSVKQTLPALLKDSVGRDMDPEIAAYFEEFKEDGGQTGWGFVKDVGTIAAEIEAEVNEKNRAQKARDWMMKNSIDVVENVNDAFENSIRLSAYIEARKAGVSRAKAAELAKNITVNFNRSGELGPVANSWYMFFNASVQGTVRLARSLGKLKDVRKPDGELDAWYNRLNAAQKMAAGLSLITGMLTMINLGLSEEDEDGELFYNKIPDYEKERNLIIMYDGKNYLKIPLPYGFNVFANLGTAMAESAAGHREPEDAGMFLLNSAFSSFSPISFGQSKDAAKYLAKGATPTFLKPFVDIAVNETYFGSSVYRQQFPVGAPKPESEMSFRSPEGVRSFFKWMNETTGGTEFVPGALDFNPDKFWYGFEYYIGGAGQFVTRTIGTGRDLYETVTTEGEKVPMKANDFPFLRKLYGEPSKYYDADVYTENATLVSQLFKERKEAEDKNDKRYKNITKLESQRKSTEKKIKRLRKLRRDARDIKDYVERQQRIYELYEKERSLLMQFNKQFEQLRGKD